MTVIAYRDGIMAADSGVWCGDILVGHNHEKITRLPDGALLGCCGLTPNIRAAIQWLAYGGDKPDPVEEGEFGAILARRGLVEEVTHKMASYPLAGDIFCHGSHSEFMFGAMAAGASAEDAVRIAIQRCRYAAGDVHVMKLDEL